MKSKILSVLIALIMILTLVPVSLSASGDGSGSDLDNAFPVTNYTDLTNALADPARTVIELTAPLKVGGSITVPSGKTLIVRSCTGEPVTLSINTVIVQSGATLINEGGISLSGNSPINVSGIFLNYGQVYQTKIKLQTGASFTNKAGASVDDRSIVHVYGGSLINEGTIDCSVYKVGASVSCTITGVPDSQIHTTNAPISYDTLTYTPITMPTSDTKTLGLPGDDSVLIQDPDGYEVFAKGYALNLEEGQTVVIQSATDFLPYMFFFNSGFARLSTPFLKGLNYTVTSTGTYYFLIGGYDSYDTGTFTITLYEPDEALELPLDFSLDSTDPNFPGTSGTGWTWDAASKTLSLNGVKLAEGSDIFYSPEGIQTEAVAQVDAAVILPADAKVVLQSGSENFIQYDWDGIYCYGDLTISGSGSLTVNAGASAIRTTGSLTMNCPGEINLTATSSCLNAIEGITLSGCANLVIYSYIYGLYSGGDIQITNSTAQIFGWYFGILTTTFNGVNIGGDIMITRSDINASCNPTSGFAAIFAGDNLDSSVTEGHSKIILDHAILASPQGAFIVDVDLTQMNKACQTITTVAGLETATSYSQMAKSAGFLTAFDVLYDANGGTGTVTDVNNSHVRSSTVTVLPNSFTRSAYVFSGWNTAANGTGTSYSPAATFSISADVTLFAQWTKVHAVNFMDWNGTVLSAQSILNGSAAVAPANPTRAGYHFTGWSVSFSVVTSDLTVTALYAADPTPVYTVTFVDWNGTVLSTQSIASGSAAVAPANPTRTGYHFTGWDVSFANVTANLTVTALYATDIIRTGETGGSVTLPLLLISSGISALGALVILKKKEHSGN